MPQQAFGRNLKAVRLIGAAAGQKARGVVLSYDGLQIAEESFETSTEAQKNVDNALPGGRFDDRFMARTEIGGSQAVYWNPVDIREPGGVSVPDAGLVVRQGTATYVILSIGSLTRSDLVQIAKSLR